MIYDESLKIFYSSYINNKSVFSGFSTRDLGDGKFHVENIFRFFDKINYQYKKIVIMEQIHSTNIETYKSKTSEKLEKIEETDGVITKDKQIILTTVSADCVPLIFSDVKNGIVGISHQGWRGSVKRMGQKMVSRMLELGSELESIKVAIGPTIGECCYDIDEDRYFEFREEFDGYSEKIFHMRGGKIHLNLTLLNYLLLVEKGIPEANIDHFPFCTKCDKKRFFSFRRDKKEEYGEMFSFICLA